MKTIKTFLTIYALLISHFVFALSGDKDYQLDILRSNRANGNIKIIPHGTGKLNVGSGTPGTLLDVDGAISANGVGILAENLALDGGFEDALQVTCNHSNQNCARDTSVKLFGAGSAKISASSSATYDAEYIFTNTAFEGVTLDIACHVKTSSAIMNFCASNDSGSGDNCIGVRNTNLWEYVVRRIQVDSGGKFGFRITSNSGTTDAVYADNCKFNVLQTKTLNKVYREHLYHSGSGGGLTDRSQEIEFNLSNITSSYDDVVTPTDVPGSTRTNLVCNKPRCWYQGYLCAVPDDSTTSQVIQWFRGGLGGSPGTIVGISDIHPGSDNETRICAQVDTVITKDEFLTIRVFQAVANDANEVYLSLTATYYEQDETLTDANAFDENAAYTQGGNNCSPPLGTGDDGSYQKITDAQCTTNTKKYGNLTFLSPSTSLGHYQYYDIGKYDICASFMHSQENTAADTQLFQYFQVQGCSGAASCSAWTITDFAPFGYQYTINDEDLLTRRQKSVCTSAFITTPGQYTFELTERTDHISGTTGDNSILEDISDNTIKWTVTKKSAVATVPLKEYMRFPGILIPYAYAARVNSIETVTEWGGQDWLTTCTDADPSVCTFQTSWFSAEPFCFASGDGDAAGQVQNVNGTTSVSIDRTSNNTEFFFWCFGER